LTNLEFVLIFTNEVNFWKNMENTEEKQDRQLFFFVNAAIQLSAIFAFQQFAVLWPLYIVMGLLSIIVVLQTLGAAAAFSQIVSESTKISTRQTKGINILISLIYMVSCYNIYLIGFVGFAWVAATHAVIHLFTNVLGAIK